MSGEKCLNCSDYIVDRIAAYSCVNGAHDDGVGASLYELADEASEEIKMLRARIARAIEALGSNDYSREHIATLLKF